MSDTLKYVYSHPAAKTSPVPQLQLSSPIDAAARMPHAWNKSRSPSEKPSPKFDVMLSATPRKGLCKAVLPCCSPLFKCCQAALKSLDVTETLYGFSPCSNLSLPLALSPGESKGTGQGTLKISRPSIFSTQRHLSKFSKRYLWWRPNKQRRLLLHPPRMHELRCCV
jgi:hypothetical protein